MNALPTPVVSYARISDDGENDGHGVRDQHKVNRATAERFGWVVVREFTDNDRSASKADVVREDFEAMLSVVREGHLDDGQLVAGVVIVAEDRLARRAGDYERFVEALTAREGRVYADARGIRDLYSEDVEGLGLVGVAFSKIESRKVRRRIKRWHRARAEEGKLPGGPRAFGWRDEDRRRVHPIEGPMLAQALRDFTAGRSLNSIARSFSAAGFVTSRGNAWTAQSLKLSLTSPRICGLRAINGDLVVTDDGEPVRGEWEPIATVEEWRAAVAIVDARRGFRVDREGAVADALPGDFRDHKFLLTGIVRCGKRRVDESDCGARLRVIHSKDCVQHIYACPPKGNGGCGGVGRRGDMVDRYVSEAVLAKADERAARLRAPSEWSGAADLAAAEGKLRTLRQQWTADQISDALFFSMAGDLERRIAELRREQGRHSAHVMRSAATVDVRERWHAGELDLSQKRALIREMLHAVVIRPCGRGRRAFDPSLLELVWRS